MRVEVALQLADQMLHAATGKPLNDLQRTIVDQVWRGRRYFDIAKTYGCTEGHVKDVAAQLWHHLSQTLGEKVGKRSFRTAVERYLRRQWHSHRSTLERASNLGALDSIGAARAEISHSAARLAPPPPDAAIDAAIAPTVPLSAPDQTVVGREQAIVAINGLVRQGHRLIVIQGEGGMGKTTLAQHYFHTQPFERVLELLMAQESQDIVAVERVVEEWLRQDFDSEPGREFGVSLARLKRQLQRNSVQRPIGILIDNLEPALDAAGKLIPVHRRYGDLLRVLADRRIPAVTLITSRDRLCEPNLPAQHFRLPGLTDQTWNHFFAQHQITIHPPTLQRLHQAYGGNAKAMGLLVGSIQTEFDGEMQAYGQAFPNHPFGVTDLKNLIVSQVNRLAVLDADAHRLFCRLGCYRYQAVPTLTLPAIFALLWDVPPERHPSVLTSLRNRSLVECCKGRYWLHPMSRAEAITRLRASSDWEQANRQAATVWHTQVHHITQRHEALQALEAYYHYCAIGAYEAAAGVLLHSRDNQWQQFLPLASSLYRMGLIQPALEAIQGILPRLTHPQQTIELRNILGDLHWITGQVHTAIAAQQQAIQTAQACLQSCLQTSDLQASGLQTSRSQASRSQASGLQTMGDTSSNHRHRHYLQMLELDSWLSLGLYHLDLWELSTAAQLFQTVIQLSQGTPHARWAEKATVCLALVTAYLGDHPTALSLADAAQQTFLHQSPPEQGGRFAYFIQRLGQTYLCLGQLALGAELLHRAIAFAETSQYSQVKANALKGLADMHRLQGDLTQAIALHQQAIALLEEIGAKCDLADAYLQLALTYDEGESPEEATHARDRAIALFTEIQAPAQLQRCL